MCDRSMLLGHHVEAKVSHSSEAQHQLFVFQTRSYSVQLLNRAQVGPDQIRSAWGQGCRAVFLPAALIFLKVHPGWRVNYLTSIRALEVIYQSYSSKLLVGIVKEVTGWDDPCRNCKP